MKLIDQLSMLWADHDDSFLIYEDRRLRLSEIIANTEVDLSGVKAGDVVALIGDFDPRSISVLLSLFDLGAVVVPLTVDTRSQHEYFLDVAQVDVVVENGLVLRRKHNSRHELIDGLRASNHAGLVLFSTGTTGRPKAILHDMTLFLHRFETPRPMMRTINFLLFDHIGGINTLFHTLFNRGVVIVPTARTVDNVLDTCRKHNVEVLPTTPTFLRMMLMSGAVPDRVPSCLKVVTYGTERMDQPTLDEMCRLLPNTDFRQTFGMSELGIVRVKSKARDSLFMKLGGEGVETRVVNNILHIRSSSRMVGYLNAPTPFDADGWYDTKDVVEVEDGSYKVVGRISELINVGGLKFMASEVERVALGFPGVDLVKAVARSNPITGEHVELMVQPSPGQDLNKGDMMLYLKTHLPIHMVPKRIRAELINVGHRFKKI